uniref:Uncharacterized protein n=1 Tax=Brassica oleracea TaxID=3712 RepID=A0A3P6BBC1_BRAOL|nr:unnamed protein product [Brassica oleracea]
MTSRKNTHWCSTCRRGIRLLLEGSRGGVCIYCGNTSHERLYENVFFFFFFFLIKYQDFFGVSNKQSLNRPGNNNRRLILISQSSFQELFNRFSAQNRCGPPPASLTVINSMPKVKIRKKHLGLDPSFVSHSLRLQSMKYITIKRNDVQNNSAVVMDVKGKAKVGLEEIGSKTKKTGPCEIASPAQRWDFEVEDKKSRESKV